MSKAYGRLIKFIKDEYTEEDIDNIEEEINNLIKEFREDGVLIYTDVYDGQVISEVMLHYEMGCEKYVDTDSIQVRVR